MYLISTSKQKENQEAKVSKLPRNKQKINRESIIECGMNVMQANGNDPALLEFDFSDEVGSGMGPTLEFYSLTSSALRELGFLWRPMENGSLFPAPVDPNKQESNNIYALFKYMGWLTARAINDDRLLDLPFADIFWELVLQKPLNMTDFYKIDKRISAFLFELERIQKKKLEIEKDQTLDKDQRKRLIESLRIEV